MSPFLFVLCDEMFSFLLQKAKEEVVLQGINVNKHAPAISHLFFADGNILFGVVNPCEYNGIDMVVEQYGVASGQCVNFQKSSSCFSRTIQFC